MQLKTQNKKPHGITIRTGMEKSDKLNSLGREGRFGRFSTVITSL